MNWNDTEKAHQVDSYITEFLNRIEKNPIAVLNEVSKELEGFYVRYDNDQEGRGVVGHSSLMGNITSLEAVRAECIKVLKERGEWPRK